MTVVWLLLRWAGILLLALFLFVLLLLLLVLFVPVRYRAQGSIRERKPDIRLQISWLLHILHITLAVSERETALVVRLAGIALLRRDLRGQREPDSADAAGETRERLRDDEMDFAEQAAEVVSETVPTGADGRAGAADSGIRGAGGEQACQGPRFGRIAEAVKTWADKCKAAYENWSETKRRIRHWSKLIARPETKRAFVFVKEKLIRLLRAIAPRTFWLKLHFGKADDPALMGRILMYLSMLYPFLEERAELVPDFEQTVLEGEFYVRGRVRIGTVLWIALRIWRNRDVRFVRRGFRRRKATAV